MQQCWGEKTISAATAAAEADYIFKKTENRILLSVPKLGPSTIGKDTKRKINVNESWKPEEETSEHRWKSRQKATAELAVLCNKMCGLIFRMSLKSLLNNYNYCQNQPRAG